jgi:hypothetical protein
MNGMHPDDLQVMMAMAALGLGAFFVFINWACLIAHWSTGRNHSMVPLVGAGFVGVGALLLPALRPYAWAALFVDIGTLATIPFLPRALCEIWSTSRFNLLEEYVGSRDATTVHMRLFRKNIFTIWWDIRLLPGEIGLCGKGTIGNWERESDVVLVLRMGEECAMFRRLVDSSKKAWVMSRGFEKEPPELSLAGLEFVLRWKR